MIIFINYTKLNGLIAFEFRYRSYILTSCYLECVDLKQINYYFNQQTGKEYNLAMLLSHG